MAHAGAKSGTMTGSGLTEGGYNGSVSGKIGGCGRSVGVGNGVKGYVEIGTVSGPLGVETLGLEPEGTEVPDKLGAVVEGADGVKPVGAVLEGEEVALPEIEGAGEELLPLARMYGAHSSKNDSLRNFRAIAIGVSGANVVEVRNSHGISVFKGRDSDDSRHKVPHGGMKLT